MTEQYSLSPRLSTRGSVKGCSPIVRTLITRRGRLLTSAACGIVIRRDDSAGRGVIVTQSSSLLRFSADATCAEGESHENWDGHESSFARDLANSIGAAFGA